MNYNKIIELVLQCKNIILDEASASSVTKKGAADFVTKVDYAVQEFLRTNLLKKYPETVFMSEEQTDNDVSFTSPTWILDPVDGTTNLIHHYQHSAVSLALCVNGKIEFGVVYNPFTEELFSAIVNQGAYLNGKLICVSDQSDISECLVTLGTSPYNKEDMDWNFDLFKRIFKDCPDVRISGSAALDICYIACGRLEGYFEKNLKPWDYAAGSLILTEAGGKITCFDQTPIRYDINCSAIVTNGKMHSYLCQQIGKE